MSKVIDNGRRQRFVAIERGLSKLFNMHGVDSDFKTPDYILARFVMRQLKTLMDLNHDLHEHYHKENKGELFSMPKMPK